MEIPDMQHQVMGYDRSATMFAPDGHILQVEYAEKTVRLGTASIGIRTDDGVVIVSDKGVKDELIVPESAEKIYEVDDNIISAAAGIVSDARLLINQARIVAQQHRITYNAPVEVETIIREISDIKQQYTQHPGVRPFGVAVIVAGKTDDKCRLYTSDITGNYYEYNAVAIGENDEKIKEKLREKYKKEMSVEDSIKLALAIFKEILANKYDLNRFSIAYIKTKEDKIKRLSLEEIKKIK
ncbi:MAG: archaeal proteasome endopeptidase complex subunit alpha [Candidatus Nanoarchaeia archaeon]